MTLPPAVLAIALAGCLTGIASAQTLSPGAPGPFVIDLRAATSGVPSGVDFYPDLPADATMPTRGFGGAFGGHVYTFRMGPSRIGFGGDFMMVRGSTPDAASTLTAVSPQISVNFGTSDGWSHLSAGFGVARIGLDPGESVTVQAINVGGGARWFLSPRLGIGFDLRVLMLGSSDSTPSATAVAFSAGLSLK